MQDVKETPDGYHVQMDLPGIKKEDITVDVKDRALTVCAERSAMQVIKDEGESFRIMERYQGHVARSFTLPDNADEDKIDAEYTDGVLHLKIQKKPAEEGIELKKKAIKIK
jgi:HSP20 family protein